MSRAVNCMNAGLGRCSYSKYVQIWENEHNVNVYRDICKCWPNSCLCDESRLSCHSLPNMNEVAASINSHLFMLPRSSTPLTAAFPFARYVGGYGKLQDFDAEWERLGLNNQMAEYVRNAMRTQRR